MSDESHSIWQQRYTARKLVAPLGFTKKAIEYLSQRPCRLLDVGCGDGRDSLFFAENGISVTAIDFSEEGINRLRNENKDIDARVMNITDMDFPTASFDAVYAHLSLHYFDNATTEKVIANIYRMLKPGGYFFIKCKSTKDPFYGQGERMEEDMYFREYARHFFTEEYMAKKLSDFNIIELSSSEAEYDGQRSAFIEAVAQKI